MVHVENKVLLMFLLGITIISLAGILIPAKHPLTGSLAILPPYNLSRTSLTNASVATISNDTYSVIRVCSSHSDCSPGFCIGFRCENVECVDNTHCSEGLICESNVCLTNASVTNTTLPPIILRNISINITNATFINISSNRTLSFNETVLENVTSNATNATSTNATCIVPEDDLIINSNVVLCRGTYNITDVNDDGILIIDSNSISIRGNGTIINGIRHAEDQGLGILIDGLNNIGISGLTIKNVYLGAYAAGENIMFANNSFVNMLAGIYYPITPEESSLVVNAITSNSFTNVTYPVVGMIEDENGLGDQGDSGFLGGDTGDGGFDYFGDGTGDGSAPPGDGEQDNSGAGDSAGGTGGTNGDAGIDENDTEDGLDEGEQTEEAEIKSKSGDLLGRATAAYERGVSTIKGLFSNISTKQYGILTTGLFILIATIVIGVVIGAVKYYRETIGVKFKQIGEMHEEGIQAIEKEGAENVEEAEAAGVQSEEGYEKGEYEEEYEKSYDEEREETQKEPEEHAEYFDEHERQLHEYIIACKEQGVPDETIRQKLTEVGWKKELINKYL